MGLFDPLQKNDATSVATAGSLATGLAQTKTQEDPHGGKSRCGATSKMRLPVKPNGMETSAPHPPWASLPATSEGFIARCDWPLRTIWRHKGGGNVEKQFGTDCVEQPVAFGGGGRSGEDQGWCHRYPRRHLHGARGRRHSRSPDCAQHARQEGRRQGARIRHRLDGCNPQLRGSRRAQADRTGQGPDPAFTVVRRRRHCGQEFRQDASRTDFHQRRVRRAGDDIRRSGAELLPLQHGWRAMAGRARQVCL